MSHESNRSLTDALNNCAMECYHCATACLEEQDVQMLSRCIKLDMDCAAICQLTASFVARGSEHMYHLLKECGEICEACATECEKHAAHGMEHCRICAEACRHCAEECMQLAHA
jgi:hypothetical protein